MHCVLFLVGQSSPVTDETGEPLLFMTAAAAHEYLNNCGENKNDYLLYWRPTL